MSRHRRSPRRSNSGRAVAPLVGVLVLLVITVALAGLVAVGVGSMGPTEPPPVASLELSVDSADGSIVIDHVAGDTIDVEEASVTVTVEGEPLTDQPPVPFFSADGFVSGPAGPFNEATDSEWDPGERAGLRVASTNTPAIQSGDEVVVRIDSGAGTVARLETIAE